tara:strand:+ start:2280 stop:2594 length:315 start_codon:yes stop_codon:yes gene_type:complete
MAVLPKDYTAQENLIAEILSEFGLRYEQQYEFWPYTADFYIPELKMVIEADGKYGHLRKRDAKRDIDLGNQDDIVYILHVALFTKEKIKEVIWQGLSKLETKPT